MPPIGTAILKTLRYSDHFDFPLTLGEIHARLIGVKTTRPTLIKALAALRQQNQLHQKGDYYHLPGRSALVTRRLKRADLSLPQLARAKTLSSQLARLPSVLAIYLTGSLALSNSDGDSDIDLMIIALPGRLWTTRLLLTLYTSLLGLRRTPTSKNNHGKLCLNLYLTPSSYLLIPPMRSLYSAYELVQAVPLYDPRDTRSALLSANSWIKQFLPNYALPDTSPSSIFHRSSTINFFEKLVYRLQLWYMRPRLTREYITQNAAFFHPHDPAPKV